MNVRDIPQGQAVSVEVECLGSVPQSMNYVAKRDASLSSGGIEVVFTTHRVGKVSIPDLDVVKECKVDRTCGLHVHVDVRDLTQEEAKRVYERLLTCKAVLKLLVPTSRQNNRYCQWRSNHTGGNRYAAINFQSYHKFKTIEFRCQSGSTERRKIENWAELCYQLVQWARVAEPRRTQLPWKAFMKTISPDLREWVIRRRVRLHQPELLAVLQQYLLGESVAHKAEALQLRDLGLESLRDPLVVINPQPVVRVQRSTNRILGHSVCSVLRRMGQLGISQREAEVAMTASGVSVESQTIRFMLRAGSEGRAGRVAPLTIEQVTGLVVPF